MMGVAVIVRNPLTTGPPWRVIAIVLLAGILSGLAGCAGEEAKPNRDSIITTNMLVTVDRIFDRYGARAFGEMENYVSPAFTAFRPDTMFKTVSLDHEVRWVRMEDDAVQIVLGWEGTWTIRPGRDVSGGGQCTMIFSAGTGRLTGLEGDNPFVIPGRAAMPGAPR